MKLKTKKLLKVGTSAMVLALAMTATSAHAKDAWAIHRHGVVRNV
ncbi:TPA: hypothetical protein ACQQSP_006356 [Pseudomonas aeruginosa]